MKKEELFELRYYANCMENGIDPTSGLVFPEDTVMNCKKIKSYNGKVRELLDSLIVAIENDGKKTNNRKIPFLYPPKKKINFNTLPSQFQLVNFVIKLMIFYYRV